MRCSLRDIYKKAPLKTSFEFYRYYLNDQITLEEFHGVLKTLVCWVDESNDIYLEELDLFCLEKGILIPVSLKSDLIALKIKRMTGEFTASNTKVVKKKMQRLGIKLICYFVSSGFKLSESCFYASYMIYMKFGQDKIIKASTLESNFSKLIGMPNKPDHSLTEIYQTLLENTAKAQGMIDEVNNQKGIGFNELSYISNVIKNNPQIKKEYIKSAEIIEAQCTEDLREKLTGTRR